MKLKFGGQYTQVAIKFLPNIHNNYGYGLSPVISGYPLVGLQSVEVHTSNMTYYVPRADNTCILGCCLHVVQMLHLLADFALRLRPGPFDQVFKYAKSH